MKAAAGFRCGLAALILLLMAAVPLANAKCKFPAIFNFGDSNSDTGGFWAAFPAQPTPFGMTYFKKPVGRATDGRLVIDFLGNMYIYHYISFLLIERSVDACMFTKQTIN